MHHTGQTGGKSRESQNNIIVYWQISASWVVLRGKPGLKRGRNMNDKDQTFLTSKITFMSLPINIYRPKLGTRHTGRHGAKTMAEVVEVLVPGGKATAGPPLDRRSDHSVST